MNVAWGGRVLPSRARPAVASRRKYLIGLLVTLLTLAGCAPSEPPPLRVQGRTMGTQYALVILQPPRLLESRALKQDVEDILEAINAQMSHYRADSELSRFNAAEDTEWRTCLLYTSPSPRD